MNEHNHIKLRLILWFANTMNAPSEVYSPPLEDRCSAKSAVLEIGSSKHYTGPCNGPHLHIMEPSFLFGGHQGNHPGPMRDQIAHCDIGSLNIDGVEYSVSRNPRLSNHAKPCSLVIPLEDYRDLCFYEGDYTKQNCRAFKGECIVFSGDTPHGGQTYARDECWHPSIHYHMTSCHHVKDYSQFEIASDVVANAHEL